MTDSQNRRREFLTGVRDELPILVGVIPFGMIYGILAMSAGLTSWQAQGMSAIVFAGSAQFMLVQLAGTGTPALMMILTGFVINLRHALYSASLAPYLKPLGLPWKSLLSYLLTDEAYAVAIARYRKDEPLKFKHWHFLGAGLALWSAWQISTAVGIFLGAQMPPGWSLDFTLALTFIALVIPSLEDRASVMAAAAAGVVSVAAAGMPYKLGLLTAALAGILVGLWGEKR